VALEFQIITSREFFRLGAHGELDWPKSLEVLSMLGKAFVERGTDLALLDVRDTRTNLSDKQIKGLALVLQKAGFREHHRVAILHRPLPRPKAGVFATAARGRGFDIADFDNYEQAVEWLSRSSEEDPEFDRKTYYGTSRRIRRNAHPPGEGPA
jgi:hypothetical protein